MRTAIGVFVWGSLLVAACGGSEFKAANVDASAGEDAGADGAPACLVAPAGSGGERDFCNFLAAQFSACGECEACRQLDVNNCVQLGDVLSPAFKSALVACKDSLGCGDLTTYENNGCVRAQLMQAQMSSAAQQAKNAYCNNCPNNHFECQHFFDLTMDGGTAGFGVGVLTFGDRIDQQIVEQCLNNNPRCDAIGFGLCEAVIFCGNGGAPHSSCSMGLCK